MITERTLKKWRGEALENYNRIVPDADYSGTLTKQLYEQILRMTRELLDQQLLRENVR